MTTGVIDKMQRLQPVICEHVMFSETQHFLGEDNRHFVLPAKY